MSQKHELGSVLKAKNEYVGQGKLVSLLREAKFFTTQKEIKKWEEKNSGVQYEIVPARRNKNSGNITLIA
ncbi:MAG: hypothetical protein WCV41_03075 [Patescibacteria group bacterium]